MIFYAAETIAVKIDKSLVSRLSRPGRGVEIVDGTRSRQDGALIVQRFARGGGKYLRINRKLMTPR